jgi:hypothetical protein
MHVGELILVHTLRLYGWVPTSMVLTCHAVVDRDLSCPLFGTDMSYKDH